jgi:hypothetical protein
MGYVRAIRYVTGRLLKIYLLAVHALNGEETFTRRAARRLMIMKTAAIKSMPFGIYFFPFFHPSMLKPKDFDRNKTRYEEVLRPYL